MAGFYDIENSLSSGKEVEDFEVAGCPPHSEELWVEVGGVGAGGDFGLVQGYRLGISRGGERWVWGGRWWGVGMVGDGCTGGHCVFARSFVLCCLRQLEWFAFLFFDICLIFGSRTEGEDVFFEHHSDLFFAAAVAHVSGLFRSFFVPGVLYGLGDAVDPSAVGC